MSPLDFRQMDYDAGSKPEGQESTLSEERVREAAAAAPDQRTDLVQLANDFAEDRTEVANLGGNIDALLTELTGMGVDDPGLVELRNQSADLSGLLDQVAAIDFASPNPLSDDQVALVLRTIEAANGVESDVDRLNPIANKALFDAYVAKVNSDERFNLEEGSYLFDQINPSNLSYLRENSPQLLDSYVGMVNGERRIMAEALNTFANRAAGSENVADSFATLRDEYFGDNASTFDAKTGQLAGDTGVYYERLVAPAGPVTDALFRISLLQTGPNTGIDAALEANPNGNPAARAALEAIRAELDAEANSISTRMDATGFDSAEYGTRISELIDVINDENAAVVEMFNQALDAAGLDPGFHVTVQRDPNGVSQSPWSDINSQLQATGVDFHNVGIDFDFTTPEGQTATAMQQFMSRVGEVANAERDRIDEAISYQRQFAEYLGRVPQEYAALIQMSPEERQATVEAMQQNLLGFDGSRNQLIDGVVGAQTFDELSQLSMSNAAVVEGAGTDTIRAFNVGSVDALKSLVGDRSGQRAELSDRVNVFTRERLGALDAAAVAVDRRVAADDIYERGRDAVRDNNDSLQHASSRLTELRGVIPRLEATGNQIQSNIQSLDNQIANLDTTIDDLDRLIQMYDQSILNNPLLLQSTQDALNLVGDINYTRNESERILNMRRQERTNLQSERASQELAYQAVETDLTSARAEIPGLEADIAAMQSQVPSLEHFEDTYRLAEREAYAEQRVQEALAEAAQNNIDRANDDISRADDVIDHAYRDMNSRLDFTDGVTGEELRNAPSNVIPEGVDRDAMVEAHHEEFADEAADATREVRSDWRRGSGRGRRGSANRPSASRESSSGDRVEWDGSGDIMDFRGQIPTDQWTEIFNSLDTIRSNDQYVNYLVEEGYMDREWVDTNPDYNVLLGLAVVRFQHDQNVRGGADGIVGRNTRRALDRLI